MRLESTFSSHVEEISSTGDATRITGHNACRLPSVPLLSTFNRRSRPGRDCRLSTTSGRLRAMAVVRCGGNAHAAQFINVILPVKDVPLLAAFENFFFLRSDPLAHFQFDLLFF